MPVLELNDIKKDFDILPVLRGITIKVDQGEVVAIIGPSGSGKSTLLRCATLLETIDKGSMYYCSEPVATTNAAGQVEYRDNESLRKIRRYFGLVFQNFNLFPHYTVLKNIIDPLIVVQKENRKSATEQALALLAKMGLSDKAECYPYQLSGGQKQRASIVRALALKPEVLFFDEPTSALDPELTGEVLRVIRSLSEENMTMVIVTHEMSFAHQIADTVYFMDEGLVVEHGSPRQVFQEPQQERTKRFLERYSASS